jgi:lipoic acid synthetase
MTIATTRNLTRMPAWIRQNLGQGAHFPHTLHAVQGHQLHTVCEEAKCPNRGECWSRGTATFMLLGDICTRACGFCAVKTGRPGALDSDEPRRVAEAVVNMGLDYVVLTSVNRDELPDGGASIFANTLKFLRQRKPTIGVEFLTPDFRGCQENALDVVMSALAQLPETARRDLVWGHNVETVPRLYRTAKKGSKYERSLAMLEKTARLPNVEAKSALMLGLGETKEEVLAVLADLRAAGVNRVSLGQYLRPSLDNLPVQHYVHPDEFAEYESIARDMGFAWVKAGPMVRSSYFAEEVQNRVNHGEHGD